MLYTIKCRRGHCGAGFEHQGSNSDPVHNEQILGQRAISHGWVIDMDGGGWLCPFDAPKADLPSGPKFTCSGTDKTCLNACYADDDAEAVSMGWHDARLSPILEPNWLCTQCWKASQPEEPKPERPAEPDIEKWVEQTLVRNEQSIREIARKDREAWLRRLCDKIGATPTAQKIMDALEIDAEIPF